MATLRQYFETDFSNTARMHVKFSVEGIDVDAVVLFDFSGYLAYLACYVPERGRKLDFFYSLIRALDYGKTPLHFTGKIILPATKEFYGALKIEHKQDFAILARLFGDPTWVSTKDFQASRRVFIYSESDLTVNEVLSLKEEGRKLGHEIQFRSKEYVTYRTNRETPLAFISHDSRDKDAIARRIAVNLQKMLCPVWYDEFWVLPRFSGHLVKAHTGPGGVPWDSGGSFQSSTSGRPWRCYKALACASARLRRSWGSRPRCWGAGGGSYASSRSRRFGAMGVPVRRIWSCSVGSWPE